MRHYRGNRELQAHALGHDIAMADEQIDASTESAAPAAEKASRQSFWPLCAAVLALILLFNLSVSVPVAARLSQDQKNSGVVLVGYRSFGMHPTEITLDLWSLDGEKAPIDLFRSLFQAAGAP